MKISIFALVSLLSPRLARAGVMNETFVCRGICTEEGDELLNPRTDVTIDGQKASCDFFDLEAVNGTDADLCAENAQKAADAGCICGAPIDCPGICIEGEGEELLNPKMDVTIDGQKASCEFFDGNAAEVIIEEVCAENAQKAANAGCMCGIPTECLGICPTSDYILLNPTTDVTIDGQKASCEFFDSNAMEVISEEICAEEGQKAKDAGCVCAIPNDCSGICTVEGEELLNASTDVTIEGQSATCGFFETQIQEETDTDVCTVDAQEAKDAGCICGVPIECPGICAEGEELVNASTDVTIGDQSATCGFFDEQFKKSIIKEECVENSQNAKDAGCLCPGDPTSSSFVSKSFVTVALFMGVTLSW